MKRVCEIVRLCACLAGALVSLGGHAASADELVGDLYHTEVRVTGQEEPNRGRAFAQALSDVLVKLTGDPALNTDPAVATVAVRAGTMVSAFRYRDLLAGIPLHDEQGTRQRPYVLTVDFDASKVDAVLASLGRKAWPANRPRLVLFLTVDNGTAPYVLTSDGTRGRDQREALSDAATLYGIPLSLPKQTSLSELGLFAQTLPTARFARLQAVAKNFGGDLALAGTLEWSTKDRDWNARWHFDYRGETRQWSINGVSFDVAFRSAMLGAAQILSGHGIPK